MIDDNSSYKNIKDGKRNLDGIINVYKEAGFTSHDVVAKLRGILRQKKIGHTGTLDRRQQVCFRYAAVRQQRSANCLRTKINRTEQCAGSELRLTHRT